MSNDNRPEIDFNDFNPFSPDFIREPHAVWQRLLAEYPIAFHKDLQMWIVNSHELCGAMLKSNDFTPDYRVWEFAPPPKPEAEKIDFERMTDHSLFVVGRKEHLRLRKLTMPAFSRPVMSRIDSKIKDLIVSRFDEIGEPDTFDVYSEIAERLPARSIARMVGVPPDKEKMFIKFSNCIVHASRINLSPEERDKAMHDAQEGIDYFKAEVADRRGRGDPGDDFIGNLISAEEDDDSLSDWDIISIISALITAGSDTAIDLHTYLIKGLLENPDQYQLLKDDPDLMENAIIELLRYGSMGKFPFFRFAVDNTEFGGQHFGKGQASLVNLSAAWHDPAKWDQPQKLDITRNLEGNLVFGAGAHFCIGTYLVRVQARLMLNEFMRRFPNPELLDGNGNLNYNYDHHNARRINRLEVRTNLEAKEKAA
jgi:cytochrome P450